MKRIFTLAIGLCACMWFAACHDDESDSQAMGQLRDSIFVHYPATGSVHINPEDRENLIVVLGNQKLYAATPEQRQKVALEIGQMALHAFGKGSYLHTGRLVVTQDIRNESNEPKDGLATPINIDSLRKVLFP